jgi:hypothetical protein
VYWFSGSLFLLTLLFWILDPALFYYIFVDTLEWLEIVVRFVAVVSAAGAVHSTLKGP